MIYNSLAQNIYIRNLEKPDSTGLSWQPLVKNSSFNRGGNDYRTAEALETAQPLDFKGCDTTPSAFPFSSLNKFQKYMFGDVTFGTNFFSGVAIYDESVANVSSWIHGET